MQLDGLGLDMRGELLLDSSLVAALSGRPAGELAGRAPVRIPLAHVTNTLSDPKVSLSPETLAAVPQLLLLTTGAGQVVGKAVGSLGKVVDKAVADVGKAVGKLGGSVGSKQGKTEKTEKADQSVEKKADEVVEQAAQPAADEVAGGAVDTADKPELGVSDGDAQAVDALGKEDVGAGTELEGRDAVEQPVEDGSP
jgi:hypothetical protein